MIIFLTTNSSVAYERLREVRIHKQTGLMDTQSRIDARGLYNQRDNYFIHPTDDEKRILLDHQHYSAAYQDMVKYCGEDCALVDADGDIQAVLERIEHVIGRGTSPGLPRLGSMNHKEPCAEDTWGLETRVSQQDLSRVNSSTYLYNSIVNPSANKAGSTCRDVPVPENTQITLMSKKSAVDYSKYKYVPSDTSEMQSNLSGINSDRISSVSTGASVADYKSATTFQSVQPGSRLLSLSKDTSSLSPAEPAVQPKISLAQSGASGSTTKLKSNLSRSKPQSTATTQSQPTLASLHFKPESKITIDSQPKEN